MSVLEALADYLKEQGIDARYELDKRLDRRPAIGSEERIVVSEVLVLTFSSRRGLSDHHIFCGIGPQHWFDLAHPDSIA